jgi:hypothetical protein
MTGEITGADVTLASRYSTHRFPFRGESANRVSDRTSWRACPAPQPVCWLTIALVARGRWSVVPTALLEGYGATLYSCRAAGRRRRSVVGQINFRDGEWSWPLNVACQFTVKEAACSASWQSRS